MESQAYIAFLVAAKAAGLRVANCLTKPATSLATCWSGTAELANPKVFAWWPSILRPVRIKSAACFWPTSAASAVAATGGKQPSEISGNPHVAYSAVTTRSQSKVSSAPPPRQCPRTPATSTLREATMIRNIAWNFVSISSTLSGVWAATSTPEENALSDPEKTTTEIPDWLSTSSRALASCSMKGTSMMFNGGWLNSMRAMGGATWSKTRFAEEPVTSGRIQKGRELCPPSSAKG